MKTSAWLIIVGALIALVAALNERVDYVPSYLFIPSVILGFLCVSIGYARIRAERRTFHSTHSRGRWRHYAALMAAVVVGIAVGLLIFQPFYPGVPTEGRIVISLIALVLAGVFFGWDVFFRRSNVR